MPSSKPKDVRRVCVGSGLDNKLRRKLATLRDLKKAMESSLVEANQAIKDEYFWRAMEVSAVFVSTTCDVILAVFAGPAVGSVYDVSKLIVDAFNSDLTAKKAFIYSTSAKVDAVAGHLEKTVGTGKYAAALKATKILATTVDQLRDYWIKGGKDTLTSKSALIGAKRTANIMLKRIGDQIAAVETELVACGAAS